MPDAIIGIKCIGHDTSIFLLREGEPPFGLDRERITRHKHDVGFPYEPLEFIRDSIKDNTLTVSVPDIKPSYRDFEFASNRNLHSGNVNEMRGSLKTGLHIKLAKKIRNTPIVSVPNKKRINAIIRRNVSSALKRRDFSVERYDHHNTHAAGAYYFSGFDKACVITMDGQGDDYSSKIFIGEGESMNFVTGTDKYNSLGHVYGSFTEALGLRRDHDEGKVEALAGFGNPDTPLYEKLKKKIYVKGLKIVIEKPFYYDRPNPSLYKSIVSEYGDKDTAAAIQRILEEAGLSLVTNAMDEFGIKNFCFAGGTFANVQMNMRIFEETGLENMYVFPAMNDAGCAAGAAILSAVRNGWDIKPFRFDMPYFGPRFGENDIKEALEANKNRISFHREDDWPERVAELVSNGKVVGFYQGNMEYGPRALGNRSVIADPRRKETKDIINNTIKRRKPYQPFCPSVLESERERLFEKSYKNKHMTCAFRLKERFQKELPSGIHIDGTARPQFVEKHDNPNYFRMISEFKKLTGYGFVINTSFNLHGRTIVMTPEHAIQDFLDCGLDYMAMDGWIVERKN